MREEEEITAYGIPLAPFTSFKYLGRVFFESENDWTAVVSYLWRARQKWDRLTRVMRREGTYNRTSGWIYLAVVHSVIIYG